MRFDLNFLLLALSALALALPAPIANEPQISERGLGKALSKAGAALKKWGDDVKTNSGHAQNKMQGGDKWPELKDQISKFQKPEASGNMIINGKERGPFPHGE